MKPISISGEQPEAQNFELRIAAGDRDAEEELIAHFAPRVRLFVAARAAGRNFLEEVVQDTMMALVCVLREGRLREPENLSAMVYGIARNKLADTIRKTSRDRTVAFPKDFDCPALSTEGEQEVVAAAQREIERLEPADRRILWMTLIDGCKPAEVAASTGMSPEAVRQRKSRALKKLLDRIKPLSRIGRESRLFKRRPK